MIPYLLERGPYLLYGALVVLGFYLTLTHRNLLKAMVGLGLVQSGVIIFFVTLSVRRGGTVPVLDEGVQAVHNPLPHALMLTAIVVAVSTLGVAMAMLKRLQEEQGSVEDRDSAEGR